MYVSFSINPLPPMLVFEKAAKYYGLNKYVCISRFSTNIENTWVKGCVFELTIICKDKEIMFGWLWNKVPIKI